MLFLLKSKKSCALERDDDLNAKKERKKLCVLLCGCNTLLTSYSAVSNNDHWMELQGGPAIITEWPQRTRAMAPVRWGHKPCCWLQTEHLLYARHSLKKKKSQKVLSNQFDFHQSCPPLMLQQAERGLEPSLFSWRKKTKPLWSY